MQIKLSALYRFGFNISRTGARALGKFRTKDSNSTTPDGYGNSLDRW